ncbi:heme-dependent oxidative N-demethylase family protein [Nocardia sp. NPDC004722]
MTTIEYSEALRRFPFPFTKDEYRYSTNIEPAGTEAVTAAGAWGARQLDIDEHYAAELAQRTAILDRDPERSQCLPHMAPAAWDAMLTLMEQLAVEYPAEMSLTRDGSRWRWRNHLLGTDLTFVYGDDTTLPAPPLRYIADQVQEDIVLLDQREGKLWGDAGVVTFAADWSMGFDCGMSFLEIHGPVPRIHTERVITRAHDFLLRLRPEQAYRRTNWTLTVDGKLDTSTEGYPEWGRDRRTLAEGPLAEVGDRLYLRVEVQHLIRLANSGAVMFLIRTYLRSFREVASVPAWGRRLHRVLAELPQDMADYKGLTRTREPAVAWLASIGMDE